MMSLLERALPHLTQGSKLPWLTLYSFGYDSTPGSGAAMQVNVKAPHRGSMLLHDKPLHAQMLYIELSFHCASLVSKVTGPSVVPQPTAVRSKSGCRGYSRACRDCSSRVFYPSFLTLASKARATHSHCRCCRGCAPAHDISGSDCSSAIVCHSCWHCQCPQCSSLCAHTELSCKAVIAVHLL